MESPNCSVSKVVKTKTKSKTLTGDTDLLSSHGKFKFNRLEGVGGFASVRLFLNPLSIYCIYKT